MKDTLKIGCIAMMFCLSITSANAQNIFTADSISSGNTKDVITNFFQLAFNNFTGKSKEFNFNSNPYALMVRANPNLVIDTSYAKYTSLRRLNFAFGLKLDSNYKFNGFSSGIKFALVDKRDSTTSKILFQNIKTDSFNVERRFLRRKIDDYKNDSFPNSTDAPKRIKEMREFIDVNLTALLNDDKQIAKMDTGFVKIVLAIVEANKDKLPRIVDFFKNKPTYTFKQLNDSIYIRLKNEIKSAPLWTIGLSDTMYKDKPVFSNVVLVSEYAKGVFNPQPHRNNFEINAKASLNFSNDTLRQKDNLKRVVFNSQVGINWVVRDKVQDISYFELKAAVEYNDNVSNNLYFNEKKEVFTLNGTARLRIYADIWLPFEIKYDPENGNLFGFLSVKTNFKALAGFAKGK